MKLIRHGFGLLQFNQTGKMKTENTEFGKKYKLGNIALHL